MLVRLAIAAFALIAPAPQALACTCLCQLPHDAGWKGWIGEADYVFRGEVLSSVRENPFEDCRKGESMEACSDRAERDASVFRIKVFKLLKGKKTPQLTIRAPYLGSMCGVSFEPGKTYDVLAFREQDGNLHVSQCSQYCGRLDGAFKGLASGK